MYRPNLRNVFILRNISKRNVLSSLAFNQRATTFEKNISSKVIFEKIKQFWSRFDRYRDVRCPKIKTEHPGLSSPMINFLKRQNIGQRVFVVSFWH